VLLPRLLLLLPPTLLLLSLLLHSGWRGCAAAPAAALPPPRLAALPLLLLHLHHQTKAARQALALHCELAEHTTSQVAPRARQLQTESPAPAAVPIVAGEHNYKYCRRSGASIAVILYAAAPAQAAQCAAASVPPDC
jgi:hypothetical protein